MTPKRAFNFVHPQLAAVYNGKSKLFMLSLETRVTRLAGRNRQRMLSGARAGSRVLMKARRQQAMLVGRNNRRLWQ